MKNLIKLVINLALLCLIFLNSSFLFSQKKTNEFTVVLDAGHGGKDPGNRGNVKASPKAIALAAITCSNGPP